MGVCRIPDRIYEMHAEMCRVFTNPTRLKIIDLLGEGEMHVSEIAERLGVSQPNVSQHLALMRGAGAVRSERRGNAVYYRMAHPDIRKAFDLIQNVLVSRSRESAVLMGVGG